MPFHPCTLVTSLISNKKRPWNPSVFHVLIRRCGSSCMVMCWVLESVLQQHLTPLIPPWNTNRAVYFEQRHVAVGRSLRHLVFFGSLIASALTSWFCFRAHASQVCFKPGIGNPRGCRALTRLSLDRMCLRAKCTILHQISNDYLDAYVLSESSLFVYPHKAST